MSLLLFVLANGLCSLNLQHKWWSGDLPESCCQVLLFSKPLDMQQFVFARIYRMLFVFLLSQFSCSFVRSNSQSVRFFRTHFRNSESKISDVDATITFHQDHCRWSSRFDLNEMHLFHRPELSQLFFFCTSSVGTWFHRGVLCWWKTHSTENIGACRWWFKWFIWIALCLCWFLSLWALLLFIIVFRFIGISDAQLSQTGLSNPFPCVKNGFATCAHLLKGGEQTSTELGKMRRKINNETSKWIPESDKWKERINFEENLKKVRFYNIMRINHTLACV